MRIVYPLLWSRLGRQACREQSVNTAAALARRGHEVTLLMPRGPDDPELTARELREWFAVEGEFRLVQRPSRWAGERLSVTLMRLREVFRDPQLRGADLLYSRIPAMLVAGGRSPIPFATDHYRPWPDDYPWAGPLFRRTAAHRRCLGLVLHSEHAAGAYRRAGISEERILVAHNGVAPPPVRLDRAEARSRLALPVDRQIAVYAGRLNEAKGLDSLFEVARLRPDILFVLVGSEGDGPIERRAAALANVRIAPWAEPGALPAWLQAADVLVVPPSSAPLERHRNCVLPMKLFAYLASGRPILAPQAPDTAELLAHGDTAWLVPPDLPEAAAAGLDRLLGDGALASRLGEAALRLSSGLTWDARAEKIASFLQARLAQRSLYSSTVIAPSAATAGAAQAPTAAGR